jgi:hypothetical protein
MRKLGKAFAALAVAGAIAAGGSAFTASQTVVSSYAGTGTQTISGANVVNVHYDLDASKANITAVSLVFAGDTTDQEVFLSLDGTNPSLCVGGGGIEVAGVFAAAQTSYTCTVSVATSAAVTLHVVVADDDLQTSPSVGL